MMDKRKLVSKSYYKGKKSRCLKRSELLKNDNCTKSETVKNNKLKSPAVKSACSEDNISSINSLRSDSLRSSNSIEIIPTDTVNISSSSGTFYMESTNILPGNSEVNVQNADEIKIEEQNMYTKIHDWATNNIAKVPLSSITELLSILKSEGYVHFPNTAHSLLGFKHSIKTRKVPTKRNSVGDYVYQGM